MATIPSKHSTPILRKEKGNVGAVYAGMQDLTVWRESPIIHGRANPI